MMLHTDLGFEQNSQSNRQIPPPPVTPQVVQRHQVLMTYTQQQLSQDAQTAAGGRVPPDPIGPPPLHNADYYSNSARTVPTLQLLNCSGKWANMVIGASTTGPILSPIIFFINKVFSDPLGRIFLEGWMLDPVTGNLYFHNAYPGILVQIIWC